MTNPYSQPNITPPCMGCEDRRAGCHGGCEAYKAYKDTVQEMSAQVFDYKNKYRNLVSTRRGMDYKSRMAKWKQAHEGKRVIRRG